MSFTAENLITLIVALIVGLPGLITVYKSYRENKVLSRVDWIEMFLDLLKIATTFYLILQKIFIEHPEINGDLRGQWIEASAKMDNIRKKTDEKEG